jgi:hypothetical protein
VKRPLRNRFGSETDKNLTAIYLNGRKCPFGCNGYVTAMAVGQRQRLYSGVRMFTGNYLSSPPQIPRCRGVDLAHCSALCPNAAGASPCCGALPWRGKGSVLFSLYPAVPGHCEMGALSKAVPRNPPGARGGKGKGAWGWWALGLWPLELATNPPCFQRNTRD